MWMPAAACASPSVVRQLETAVASLPSLPLKEKTSSQCLANLCCSSYISLFPNNHENKCEAQSSEVAGSPTVAFHVPAASPPSPKPCSRIGLAEPGGSSLDE